MQKKKINLCRFCVPPPLLLLRLLPPPSPGAGPRKPRPAPGEPARLPRRAAGASANGRLRTAREGTPPPPSFSTAPSPAPGRGVWGRAFQGSSGVLGLPRTILRVRGKAKGIRAPGPRAPGPAGEGWPCPWGAPPFRGKVAGREDAMVRKESGSRGWRKRGGPANGTAKEPGVGAKRVEGGGGFGATGGAPEPAWSLTRAGLRGAAAGAGDRTRVRPAAEPPRGPSGRAGGIPRSSKMPRRCWARFRRTWWRKPRGRDTEIHAW